MDNTPNPSRLSNKESPLSLSGPAGTIEARITQPAAHTHPAVAVVCHPHPLHGGSLDNKVTATLARSLCAAGVPVVRFNFRGVGGSDGSFAAGVGETEDLLTVIHHTQALFPDHELWLAGFSFGAYVALRAAQNLDVARLITVAPPVNLYDCQELSAPDCPWLLIQGRDDEVVPFKDVARWSARLYPAPHSIYLDEVGHYFHGKLRVLQSIIASDIAEISTK